MSNISQTAVYESNDYFKHYIRHTLVEYKPQKRIIKFGSRYFSAKYYLEFPYVQFVLKETSNGEQIFFATASENPINLKLPLIATPLPLTNVNSAGKVCLNMPMMGKLEECVTHFWNSIFNQDITSSIRAAIRFYFDNRIELLYGKNFEFYAYMGDLAEPAPHFYKGWQENGFPYQLLSYKVDLQMPKNNNEPVQVDEVAKIFFNMSLDERMKVMQKLCPNSLIPEKARLFSEYKNAFYKAIQDVKNN